MNSDSSGKINYWPGFVDAFSNLVLALVFVIVILAMSLGMFSGLMAKMAIQRALVDQQLKESEAAASGKGAGKGANGAGGGGEGGGAGAGGDSTLAPGALQSRNGSGATRAELAGKGAEPAKPEWAGTSPPESAGSAAATQTARGATAVEGQSANAAKAPDSAAQAGNLADEHRSAPVNAGMNPDQVALLQENDALRQEIAALRKKNAAPQTGTPIDVEVKPAPSGDPKSSDKFEPTLPEGDHHFNQRIETDLQRVIKELEGQRDNRANINVVIHVPSYALTENKRTALFYLISIKDYLMKRKVSSERIRMHMTPAPAGQKDMSVSMSVEP